jgi:hypothetical protein
VQGTIQPPLAVFSLNVIENFAERKMKGFAWFLLLCFVKKQRPGVKSQQGQGRDTGSLGAPLGS